MLVVLGAVAVAAALPTVLAILHALLIADVIILGVGAAALVGLLAWRWRRWPASAARAMPPLRQKMARAAQPEVHLHLHGVSAADIAAILARHEDEQD